MAFNVNNLTEVRALGNNRWHWHYFTTDSLATVLGADYFSTPDGLAKFHRGDVLEIVASTAAEYQQVSIASVAGGSVVIGQPTVPDAAQAGQAVNKRLLDQRGASVVDCGAKGDDSTDDSGAFAAAWALSQVVIVPPAAVAYRVRDLNPPAGTVFAGLSLPDYDGFSGEAEVNGLSTLRLHPSGASMFKTDNRLGLVGLIFDGHDKTRDFIIPSTPGNKVYRLYAESCGFHRFRYAIGANVGGSDVYFGTPRLIECMISANNTGIKNTIDGYFLHVTVNKQDGDGVTLLTGADSNTFDACRIEWNGGNGLSLYQSNNNQANGCFYDANTGHNIRCQQSQLSISGGVVKRGGRNGSDFNILVDAARKFVCVGIQTAHGLDDASQAPDSPATCLRVTGACGTVIVRDNDLLAGGATTALEFYSSPTFTYLDIAGNAGVADRPPVYGRATNIAGGGGTASVTLTLSGVVLGSPDDVPFELTVAVRNRNTQARDWGKLGLLLARDSTNSGNAYANGLSRIVDGGGTGPGTTSGRVGPNAGDSLQVTVASVAADGSTVTLTITNHHSSDARDVEVTGRVVRAT